MIFQAILMLDNDCCEKILRAEEYNLENNLGNIFHIAARYNFPLKVCNRQAII